MKSHLNSKLKTLWFHNFETTFREVILIQILEKVCAKSIFYKRDFLRATNTRMVCVLGKQKSRCFQTY